MMVTIQCLECKRMLCFVFRMQSKTVTSGGETTFNVVPLSLQVGLYHQQIPVYNL